MSKVEPIPFSGCWLWLGSLHGKGYGHFRLNGNVEKAHRAGFALFKSDIPGGMQVLHRCDVRCCVNPEHMFVGTHQDNMADMVAKGRARAPQGEKHSAAKLTDDAVRTIRNAPPRNGRKLAKQYGVSPTVISAVRKGHIWRHIQ